MPGIRSLIRSPDRIDQDTRTDRDGTVLVLGDLMASQIPLHPRTVRVWRVIPRGATIPVAIDASVVTRLKRVSALILIGHTSPAGELIGQGGSPD